MSEIRKPITAKQATTWRAFASNVERAQEAFQAHAAGVLGHFDDIPLTARVVLDGETLVCTIPDQEVP